MATTAYSNVINLQPGGPRVTAMTNRILLECRDLAARRLREALREMLKKTGETLLQRADITKEADERRSLLRLHDQLHENGSRLEGLLAAHWGREFDASMKDSQGTQCGAISLDELQIVEFGEMDEDLALKSLARLLNDRFEGEFYALERRFNYLLGKEGDNTAKNPAAPETLSRALQSALREANLDIEDRLELYRNIEMLARVHLGPIFHAINAHLLQHNVLPDLRRDYSRATGHTPTKAAAKDNTGIDMFNMLQRLISGATQLPPASHSQIPPSTGNPAGFMGSMQTAPSQPNPPTHIWASLEALQHAAQAPFAPEAPTARNANVLYQFRASDVGQGLGQLDAITVDIVAMLFDMIFDDREISDPIKAQVGKLQIPVLKVAMLDRSFFSSKAHPTRRLLDLISRAALRWGRQVGHDDPIYKKIAEIIDNIHDNFKQDTALFKMLGDDLERFLAEHENASSCNISRAALLVVQRELDELADMAVGSELQHWLDGQLPKAVADLLDREWRTLLKRIHLEEGPDSSIWESTLATACDLVDSVRPKNDIRERQALARQLPQLIRQLSIGFDRIGVDGERRRTLLDALFTLHAAALRGTELPALYAGTEPAAAQDEPSVTSQVVADGEITLESISVKSPIPLAAAHGDIKELQRGDWVEYMQADGSAIRYRLSWISPQRGIFLFTNPHSPHALAVSPEAMSLQVARGEVRIVSTEPIFDRALTRAIDILQAA